MFSLPKDHPTQLAHFAEARSVFFFLMLMYAMLICPSHESHHIYFAASAQLWDAWMGITRLVVYEVG